MELIPNKIKIGCITYEVVQTDETLTLDNCVCSGIIEYENALIKLNNKRNEQNIAQTFWHEVMHGIVKERALKIEGDEELIIDEIAKALYSLMKENDFPMPGQK